MFPIRSLTRYIAQARQIRWQSNSNDTQSIEKTSTQIEEKSDKASALWATSETNGLIRYLSSRIQTSGPISVADFMREALVNPKHGFNGRHEQFARKDDAIVNLEVHRMFAEQIAKWVVQQDEKIGGSFLQLVEMGPGQGFLMKQIIETLRQHKYRDSHTFIALYEPNRLMRRRQAQTLLGRAFDPLIGNDYRVQPGKFSLIWFEEFKQLLQFDTCFIALDFFNMYPVHKFQKTKDVWKEVMIDWNPLSQQLQYVLALKPTTMTRLYQNFLNSIKDRRHVEISPQRASFMQAMCKHIANCGGSMLIADYAHWAEKQDTFRAFRKDQMVDPLSDPGNVDIITDVDYEELVARGTQVSQIQFFGPISQGNFLYNLGMNDQIDTLLRDKTPEEQEEIFNDIERLVSSEFLGDRVLYLCAQRTNKINIPPGFSSRH